jgi:lactate dehydrogenase-like 2-hydroxyacid dehydrogenase
MRVVAYSIKSFEKEPLALANHKKHEITLISNTLSEGTAAYAEGKEAVLVYHGDEVNANVIDKLADLGVKFIATRSTSISHIDQQAAAKRNIKIASVPATAVEKHPAEDLPMILATATIHNLDQWQQKKCLGNSCICSKSCDSHSKINI